MTNFSDHIEIVPGKRFGKATIKGTRKSVSDVLNWLSNGMTKEEIVDNFPELSEEKTQGCLGYAAIKEKRLPKKS